MLKRHTILKVGLVALGGVGIGLLGGCGNQGASPLAPKPVTQNVSQDALSDSPFTVVFSPKGLDPSKNLLRAMKPTASRTDKDVFSPKKDGKLEVEFDDPNNNGGVRVKGAEFQVKKGSLDRQVEITMTVFSGSALSDVIVNFTPSGLKFSPPATLSIEVSGDLSAKDLQGMKAYHVEGKKVTELSIQFHPSGKNEWTITIRVPSFSSYSLGDLVPETSGG